MATGTYIDPYYFNEYCRIKKIAIICAIVFFCIGFLLGKAYIDTKFTHLAYSRGKLDGRIEGMKDLSCTIIERLENGRRKTR